MVDNLYKQIIERSSEAYALIKLDYSENDSISDFTFTFSNSSFKNLINKNCNLSGLVTSYIKDKNLNFFKNKDNSFKWTCKGSDLEYIVSLSFLDKYNLVINITHTNINSLDQNYKDMVCDIKEYSKCNLEKSEKKYRLLFESMYEGFALHKIVLDKDGNPIDYVFLDINSAFEKYTGLKREDLLGKRVLSVLPQTEKSWIENYGKVALTGEPMTIESYSREIDKTFLIKAFSPEKYKFAVAFIDVTQLKQLEKSLTREKELFKTTLFSVADGVISTDKNGKINIMNKVAETLTGWSQEEAIGKPLDSVFNLIDEFTKHKIKNPLSQVMYTDETVKVKNSVALVSKNNKVIPIENSIAPIKCVNGTIQGTVLVFRDVSTAKEKIREIEFLSYHDQLTGLFNRRYFEMSFKKLDNENKLPLSVIMIDVNGLKLANDAFGHSMGDKLLLQVSKILSTVFNNGEVVARLGGDEFSVILPNTDSEKTSEFIDKVKCLSEESELYPIKVSMALGWETKTNIDENIGSIIKKAETYMYKNKMLESQVVKSKTIETVIESLYRKNLIEEEHSHRVGCLCEVFGRALHLDNSEIEELRTLGILHDIGKIAIDDKVLDKPGRLTEYEFKEVKRHSETGYNILSSVNDMSRIANYVLTHHENFDGTGYPKKTKGKDIPLPSRIIKIIDAYDAMTQDRPYRLALSKEKAIAELRRFSGYQFDPELVEIFIKNVIRES